MALARDDFSKAEDMDAHRDDVYAENDLLSPVAGPRDSKLSDWTTLKSGARFDGDENGLEGTLTHDRSPCAIT